MTQEEVLYSPYMVFNREEWSHLKDEDITHLLVEDLDKLNALNEPLTLDEIREIYLPLSRLLNFHLQASKGLYKITDTFLHKQVKKVPFIIAIAGSVAVGKSTTARVLQYLLSLWEGNPKVELVTTDGFLYPNRILEAQGLMNRKGFPESYDKRKLINFLADVKSGVPRIAAPVYSHLYYDVQEDEIRWIEQPDIVIVEGINVLQGSERTARVADVTISDFFDFSIYVDAKAEYIRRWYVDRFETLKKSAFTNPDSYFHKYSGLKEAESRAVATKLWEDINELNLEENIITTRNRANLILKKGPDHFVEQIMLKKL